MIRTKKRALFSVFNKKGIAKLARFIKEEGYEIVASEGTGRELTKHRIPFVPAKKISKNPKGLGTCIKTISFYIEGGILFNRHNSVEVKEALTLDIRPIDIVICNFPPIKEVVKNPDRDFHIGNVDVGGPLMVRAAATNFKNVLIIVDPKDYNKVTEAIEKKKLTINFRQRLAIKAYACCIKYDRSIVQYLRQNKIGKLFN